jgi:hypothetical protein
MKTKNVIWRQYYWIISATVLLALLAGSGFEDTKHPLEERVKQVVISIYPIEKVGVIARSVTFPSVLNRGQAIIDTKIQMRRFSVWMLPTIRDWQLASSGRW